ncbi:MAG TPA: hypothetical protein VFE34_05630 [Dongiaceae bacterium]|jgi:hypothetical protein|nr:hypothetical protein [Dongiaceae bacterium]
MQEIPRAILLPPPSPPSQRASVRIVESDPDSAAEAARGTRRQPQATTAGSGQAFLTLIEARREDTVEIKGKQFRFRPYGNRGAGTDSSTREAELTGEVNETEAVSAESEDSGIAVDILDGFGAGNRERNSSAFVASFIAQERLRQGLYNPQYETASDAYRRAGGSPSAIDNQPRVVSFAV